MDSENPSHMTKKTRSLPVLYQTKTGTLSGTRYADVMKKARDSFSDLKKRTKRKPYIRSAYFNKEKIFFDYFWFHLWRQGGWKEKARRLRYFQAALELLRYSRNHPTTKENPNNESEILHRFSGLTKEKEQFFVQVKEDKRSGRKYFMSCFPDK